MYRIIKLPLIAIYLFSSILFLSGCGGAEKNSGGLPIIFTDPENGIVNVPVNTIITVVFTKPMNKLSLTGCKSCYLSDGTNAIHGTPVWNEIWNMFTFTPSGNLKGGTQYTMTLSTNIVDAEGNPLDQKYIWTFTTAEASASDISFASQIQPIFNDHCISCHTSSGEASFLDLTSGNSYENLVDVSSTKTHTGSVRVKPGDPTNSVLYQRISGAGLDPEKSPMPFGDPSLCSSAPDKCEMIRAWIENGAWDN